MTNEMSSTFRNSWLIAIALTGWLLYLLAPVLTTVTTTNAPSMVIVI